VDKPLVEGGEGDRSQEREHIGFASGGGEIKGEGVSFSEAEQRLRTKKETKYDVVHKIHVLQLYERKASAHIKRTNRNGSTYFWTSKET